MHKEVEFAFNYRIYYNTQNQNDLSYNVDQRIIPFKLQKIVTRSSNYFFDTPKQYVIYGNNFSIIIRKGMLNSFERVDTPSFKQFVISLEKSRQANSTCVQSISDNSQNHHAEDEIFVDSSLMSKCLEETRRHSSYQVQIPPLTFHRYSQRDNVQEGYEKFERIELILKDENLNLKKQNQHLMKYVLKLRQAKHQYKYSSFNQGIELKVMEEELQAQLKRTKQMQRLMFQLINLEIKMNKINENGDHYHNSDGFQSIEQSSIQE